VLDGALRCWSRGAAARRVAEGLAGVRRFELAPDGDHLAYLRTDEAGVDTFTVVDHTVKTLDIEHIKYPKSGTVDTQHHAGQTRQAHTPGPATPPPPPRRPGPHAVQRRALQATVRCSSVRIAGPPASGGGPAIRVCVPSYTARVAHYVPEHEGRSPHLTSTNRPLRGR